MLDSYNMYVCHYHDIKGVISVGQTCQTA